MAWCAECDVCGLPREVVRGDDIECRGRKVRTWVVTKHAGCSQ